jgi:hypothetical protein
MSWLRDADLKLVLADELEALVTALLRPCSVASLIGFDTEQPTLDVTQDQDLTVCVTLSNRDMRGWLIPCGFAGFAGNIERDFVREQMLRLFNAACDGKIVLCGAQIAYDLEATHTWHRRYFPAHAIQDSILKAWVADPGGKQYGRAFGLKPQSLQRLGREMMEFTDIAPEETVQRTHPRCTRMIKGEPVPITRLWPERRFDRLDPTQREVLEYAIGDAINSRQLCRAIKLSPADQALYEFELRTTENVRGYRSVRHYIDVERSQAMYDRRCQLIADQLSELKELTRPDVRTTPQDISDILYVPLGRLQAGKLKERVKKIVTLTEGGEYKRKPVTEIDPNTGKRVTVKEPVLQFSTSKKSLEAVLEDDEATEEELRIAELVLEQRSPQHDISTYLLPFLAGGTDHRLRFDVKHFGQITARFSGASPQYNKRAPWTVNTLTIPRDPALRQCIAAPVGMWFVVIDFASEEPRILANLSRDPVLIALFQSGIDFHRKTASILFGISMDAVTSVERGVSKTQGLATIYKQGAESLALNLRKVLIERGIPEADHIKWAQAAIERIEGEYVQARAWKERMKLQSLIGGSVVSGYGRRIPRDRYEKDLLTSGHEDGPNAAIQSTGADILRIALEVGKEFVSRYMPGSDVVDSLHDSLELHVLPEHVRMIPKLQRTIEHAVTLPDWPVSMKLDAQIGHSFGQLYKWGKCERDTFPDDILHADESLQGDKVVCDTLEAFWGSK